MNEIYFSEKYTKGFWPFSRLCIISFLDFAHNDRWAWCSVVFLQFTGPVNVFLFNWFLGLLPKENNHSILEVMFLVSSKYSGFYKVRREKCPNTDFFLVRIFRYSVRIWENTDQKKLCICALFTKWEVHAKQNNNEFSIVLLLRHGWQCSWY